MIVDSHAHVISADPVRYPLMCPEHDDDPWYRTVPLSTEELLHFMNSAGVGRTVLVQPIRAYGNDNRYLADSCAAYKDRFAGVGVLDVEREQDARAKMRQLIQEWGLRLPPVACSFPSIRPALAFALSGVHPRRIRPAHTASSMVSPLITSSARRSSSPTARHCGSDSSQRRSTGCHRGRVR